jgi:hypothetical protein
MEQLMADSGVPWAIRRLAKSMNFGIGKTFVTISQQSDTITFVTEIPTTTPTENTFHIDEADWQNMVEAGGKAALAKVSWDGDAFIMERRSLSGDEQPTVIRRLDPGSGELVEVIPTSKGGKVMRFFQRQ